MAAIRDAVGQVDRIVEVAIGQNLDQDLKVIRVGGAVVSYAAGPENPTVPVRAAMIANVTLRFVLLYRVPHEVLRAAAQHVTEAVAAGALTALPVHRFPLDEVAAAHEAVESGVTGKVLVDIG